MVEKKRVLVACGTSIATATLAASKVKDVADGAGIPVEIIQCKAAEIRGRIQTVRPHLIVAMTPVPNDLDVPVLSGIPFLSGIQADKLKEDIVEILRK